MRSKRSIEWHSESGAVLAESCIGLALMAFAWILLSYTSFLGTNHIRTAMASRHAAWLKGATPDGPDPSSEAIEQAFFFDTGLVTVNRATKGTQEGFNDASAAKMAGNGKGPFKFEVRFGIPARIPDAEKRLPFSAMSVKIPLIQQQGTLPVTSVETECQWESVGDSWMPSDGDYDLGLIARSIGNIIQTALGGIGSLLGIN